ncbi:MAG TPA: hypothetical protein VGW12_05795 [Pyrinomonadaceae bacterium]|nr:hypothetical protein [Pyrinomonadaceae bacterium]
MSDYLWDKTGEADEDVAQLENLLGALKYQPRPLEIPADAMPATKTTATTMPRNTRTATFFSRPRLALAASLVLTLLAGLWLVTRDSEPRKDIVAKVEQGGAPGGGRQTDKVVVPNSATDQSAPNVTDRNTGKATDDKTHGATQKSSTAAAQQLKAQTERPRIVTASNAKPHRTSRQLLARRQKLQTRPEENVSAPREEIVLNDGMRLQADEPLTPQQREATEQLMFALRLTSAKLNYAQREMREIGRAGK